MHRTIPKTKFPPPHHPKDLENKNKEAEILILTIFSKVKGTRISRSSQTTLTSKNNFKRAKTNIYLPEKVIENHLLHKIAKLP